MDVFPNTTGYQWPVKLKIKLNHSILIVPHFWDAVVIRQKMRYNHLLQKLSLQMLGPRFLFNCLGKKNNHQTKSFKTSLDRNVPISTLVQNFTWAHHSCHQPTRAPKAKQRTYAMARSKKMADVGGMGGNISELQNYPVYSKWPCRDSPKRSNLKWFSNWPSIYILVSVVMAMGSLWISWWCGSKTKKHYQLVKLKLEDFTAVHRRG